ncbi:hypothetical protein A2662_03145 [Candidatus Giovannonibacteria bacterium RIFCSPHIGHO2_01_FULL_45_33]|uniref:Maf-like protein n=1 Tax=Candidatus Giovannonibacteria bacterium RIFCSPLOWO2_01_FULL_45_34 TaxID=1798351 RepID=A0A1F5WYY5_9BACT|nr:MAG: hypothetical protein A2662_03145 [Candidatus Giovannonibacteria bacterium RIFCSPHIGHO2_01_FULL_45_33]OGF80858.1 MAG: hypothetical protein A2930_03405 [Candidatus Giovannonibacteria bacterium RIFCSPLOWO2_01_FULL_45_34]
MKSIVFCSSQRFAGDLHKFMDELHALAKEKGMRLTVLHPEFSMDMHKLHSLSEKERLQHPAYRAEVAGKVYDHLFRKVKVADVCFVYNKDGYLGVNVAGELFAAAVLGKMVYALDEKTLMGHYPHDLYEEPSARKLIHEVISTPADLLERLI